MGLSGSTESGPKWLLRTYFKPYFLLQYNYGMILLCEFYYKEFDHVTQSMVTILTVKYWWEGNKLGVWD